MTPTESQSAPAQQHASAIRELAAIAIGAILAMLLLSFSSKGPETRFEDLALGQATSSYYAKIGDYPIHCNTLEDGDACIRGFRARGRDRGALWLGNSQLHGVNQLKPGQVTASAILSERMRKSGVDLLTFSQPNANLQEHLVLFMHLTRLLPLEWLILPVVFDDLRETSIRAGLAAALVDPETQAALADTEVGRRIIEQNQDVSQDDFAALDETVQDAVEERLNAWLDRNVRLWAARPEMRGRLVTNLHLYRNAALGITAQSERKLIRGRYRMNMAALEAILVAASESGIKTLVYVAPLRNDVAIPYDETEYARFKLELEELATRHGATFANLESTVPGEFWGMKDSTDGSGKLELDFMHFQAPGHALLAQALGDLIEARMNGNSQ